MEIKGKIHEIGETQNVTDTFKKREMVVEYAENPQYPEYVKMEAIQDKCSLLDPLNIGNEVEVFFNIKGRPWTDKNGKKQYFNTLQIWKLNIVNAGNVPDVQAQVTPVGDDDKLPF